MAKQSSMNQERNTIHGARLSLPMQELLGAVIRAFDTRRLMINAASQGEKEYHPESCSVCSGTGFILIPNLFEEELSDSDEEAVKAEESGGLLLKVEKAEVIPAAPSVPSPAAVAGGASTSANAAPAATSNLASAFGALGIQAGHTAPPADTLESSYPISAVIPGFHSLGPNSGNPVAPPEPSQAVFTGDEERYYAITKGVRVGVFGGWPSTSPYVTGVASAAFSRHRTLQTAYKAYETAYTRGSVAYV
ncbi:hypothetical protein DFP72DRAFT_1070137 [Ephemerocybe angulata]|uniref:Ribonuclease H1 N-terminal domain-containing protein n=1 Tax=Ephemerocybe angulata TaxID=980116 RepID=A0A8H6HTL2_9AGAR|nr:hypothetical protein DFP72DRAFT_1070137 [Tulosesus angulatus]